MPLPELRTLICGLNGSMRAQEPERVIYSAASVEILCCCGINSALRPLCAGVLPAARHPPAIRVDSGAGPDYRCAPLVACHVFSSPGQTLALDLSARDGRGMAPVGPGATQSARRTRAGLFKS